MYGVKKNRARLRNEGFVLQNSLKKFTFNFYVLRNFILSTNWSLYDFEE